MDWKAELAELDTGLARYGSDQQSSMAGFGTLHHAALEPGALDTRHKELIALAIGISRQCIGCIASHVQSCIEAGVSRAEIAETVNVCVLMGGGPALVYGIKALEAYDALTA